MQRTMMELATELFPICRSITGEGVRETHRILKTEIPEMKTFEVPTGTKAFDWTVPKEWRISGAYIDRILSDGGTERIVDFKDTNLHVVGYSTPVDVIVSRDELLEHVFVEEKDPEAIPYVTSYYTERWGFCMSMNQRDSLPDGEYHCVIDSELFDGSLTYSEVIFPGETDEEIFFSTYTCHPSMANNELSGPCVVTKLCDYIRNMKNRKYTYRLVFIPETIGSITYLSRNLDKMKGKVIAGFVVNCAGDERDYSMVETKYGNTLTDKVLGNVLSSVKADYNRADYLRRGSDERQYCSPGVDLPVCSVCRSKFHDYPEYHTSKDDLSLISEKGMQGMVDVLVKCIEIIENNLKYMAIYPCEPQLGKRGFHPTISKKDQKGAKEYADMLKNFLAYADGTNDLISMSEWIKVPAYDLVEVAKMLKEAGLIKEV